MYFINSVPFALGSVHFQEYDQSVSELIKKGLYVFLLILTHIYREIRKWLEEKGADP